MIWLGQNYAASDGDISEPSESRCVGFVGNLKSALGLEVDSACENFLFCPFPIIDV